MSLSADLLSEACTLNGTHTPISDIAHKYNFTILETKASEQANGYYECFRAEKIDGSQRIVLSITTCDNDRSFDDETHDPYFNKIEIFENDNLINEYSYFYNA